MISSDEETGNSVPKLGSLKETKLHYREHLTTDKDCYASEPLFSHLILGQNICTLVTVIH
jgi:hypothetical protein